jgi:hypothetical protein
MNLTLWISVIIILIICNIIIFAVVYHQMDTPELPTWTDSFYLSIQIQTTIGMSEVPNKNVRNLVTLQSLISYVLNILLAIIAGLVIIAKYKKDLKYESKLPSLILEDNGSKTK